MIYQLGLWHGTEGLITNEQSSLTDGNVFARVPKKKKKKTHKKKEKKIPRSWNLRRGGGAAMARMSLNFRACDFLCVCIQFEKTPRWVEVGSGVGREGAGGGFC